MPGRISRLFFILLIPLAAMAEDQPPLEPIESFLARLHARPRSVMDEPLQRWDGQGRLVPSASNERLLFSRAAIESGEAIAARDRIRAGMCMNWKGKSRCLSHLRGEVGTKSEIDDWDRAEALVDNAESGMVRTLGDMERHELKSARIPDQPWSDAHWSHDYGIIGSRYADPDFPYLPWFTSWIDRWKYVQSNPASLISTEGSDAQVDALSPAEKYEMLIGDTAFTLTANLWKRGRDAFEKNGSVEGWKGICHGWAAASFSLPRPTHGITLPTADGHRRVRFYPSDLKALASLLWAEGRYKMRFIGGRCDVARPEKDKNGRMIQKECLDSNPATWHLAVTNQIGLSHRSLILDSSYDYEVWNQPVVSYNYRYFNPQTRTPAETLEQARVPTKDFTHDLFAPYRSSKAVNFVGIDMHVTYVVGKDASHAWNDTPDNDRLETVRYVYDLELDAEGQILGGEWYTNLHPDFLWVPELGARAVSDHEATAIGDWNEKHPLPDSWQEAARAAAPGAQPLAKLIDSLFAISRRPDSE